MNLNHEVFQSGFYEVRRFRAAPLILLITTPARNCVAVFGSPSGSLCTATKQLSARTRLSCWLEAGIAEDFVQLLGGLGHLAQLSGDRVEIPVLRSSQTIQIIDADHILDRLDKAERSFCLNPYSVRLVRVPVA
jgi:hypothetical protein